MTGPAQARTALEAGVDVLLVMGGDGTVRAVAAELAGHDVPLVLLPAGTGNLLARNLGVPFTDVWAAFELVFTGHDRAVDVVDVLIDRSGRDKRPEEHISLVMAGMGFDAEVMAGAGEEQKRRLGHLAYVLSARRAMRCHQLPLTLVVDDAAPSPRRCAGVVVGNCGTMTMGLRLMPDATPCDGVLDAVAFLPRSLGQWARLLVGVALRRSSSALLPRTRGQRMTLSSPTGQRVQIDGDVLGEARKITFTVRAEALLVRCPAPAHAVRPPLPLAVAA